MNNNTKNFLTLLGGLSLCYAVSSLMEGFKLKENFFGQPYPTTVKKIRMMKDPVTGISQALPSDAIYHQNQQVSYSSQGVSANIKSAPKVQAKVFSADSDIIEPFRKETGCRVNDGSNAQYVQSMSQSGSRTQYMSDSLPVSNANVSMNVNALGAMEMQPIIYDRYIYANQKNRKFGQGDPIRGDLPIVPECNSWFRPSANPQTDLRDGSLMAVFGDSQAAQEMLALRSASTGGLLNPGGGSNTIVAQNPYMAPGMVQKSSQLSNTGGVHVNAFP